MPNIIITLNPNNSEKKSFISILVWFSCTIFLVEKNPCLKCTLFFYILSIETKTKNWFENRNKRSMLMFDYGIMLWFQKKLHSFCRQQFGSSTLLYWIDAHSKCGRSSNILCQDHCWMQLVVCSTGGMEEEAGFILQWFFLWS